MRTRIKICGITRVDDALAAARLGVDAIGLVFHERSPRRVDARTAAELIEALPPFCDAVALFVDPPASRVREVLESMRVSLLQFHGDEPAEFCRAFGVPYMKAVRMRPDTDLEQVAARYEDAAALLLDAWHPELPGGTGSSFAWQALPPGLRCPVMLAGGLHADNVGQAIGIMRPYGVDVSSGVEAAPGVKDAGRMAGFVRAVRLSDNDAE
ncbi:MAG: phosphoribosylanthranilate isomerase [Gammaproteobacteria bacterium]|jgi:phosphoribosylanthranilate isomerase|nr:phosphoribosylanthranilate isomerase [Gammaproteobacteria bacterium]